MALRGDFIQLLRNFEFELRTPCEYLDSDEDIGDFHVVPDNYFLKPETPAPATSSSNRPGPSGLQDKHLMGPPPPPPPNSPNRPSRMPVNQNNLLDGKTSQGSGQNVVEMDTKFKVAEKERQGESIFNEPSSLPDSLPVLSLDTAMAPPSFDDLNWDEINAILRKDHPTLPLKSVEEFEQFDMGIYRDPILREKLLHQLSENRGTSFSHCLRSGLKTLMTDELALEFNWAGRGGMKRPFRDYDVKSVLFEAVRLHYSDVSDTQMKTRVQTWFQRSRVGQLKISRPTKVKVVPVGAQPQETV